MDLWVRKILWRRAWQPTLVLLPGKSPWNETKYYTYSYRAKLQHLLTPIYLLWNKCYHTHTCFVLLWVVVQSLNALWPHGLQHTRLPYPSPSPRDAQTQVLLWVNFLNICYYIYTQHFFLLTTLCLQDLSVLIYSNLVHSFSFLCFSWDQQSTVYFLILLLSVRIS